MTGVRIPVFGPNDFNMASGSLEPGLGPDEEQRIRRLRGHGEVDEPPAKAALRKEAGELRARAQQLSMVERELAKERAANADLEQELAERARKLDEREALIDKQLKDLEDGPSDGAAG